MGVSKGPPAHSQDEHPVGCLSFLGKDLMTFIKLPTFPSHFPTHQAVCQAHTSPAPVTPCPSQKELVTLQPVMKEKAKTLWLAQVIMDWRGNPDTVLPSCLCYLTRWMARDTICGDLGCNPLRDLDATVGTSSIPEPVLRMKSEGNLLVIILVILTIIQKC